MTMKKGRAETTTPPAFGRLDVLASRIIERIVTSANNPIATAMYAQHKQEIDGAIERHLAPRDRRGRIIRVPAPAPMPSPIGNPAPKRRRKKAAPARAAESVIEIIDGANGGPTR